MKKILILSILSVFILQACNVLYDKDISDEISEVSVKPTINVLGEPIMSFSVGSSYTDPGVEAFVGDTEIDYSIVSGEVDPNTEGFYVVTYSAENEFGWKTYDYRAVLVYNDDPYGSDISGNYQGAIETYADISKHSINGYWYISNAYAEQGTSMPVYFADFGDNTYGIVPGEHPTKGRFSGTVKDTTFSFSYYLKFKVKLLTPEGGEITKNFLWKQL